MELSWRRVNEYGDTLLHEAACRGHLEDVKKLLKTAAESKDLEYCNVRNHKDETPLHFAVLSGNYEICRILLEDYKADGCIKDHMKRSPLFIAAFSGFTEIVQLFRKCLGNVDEIYASESRNTLLHYFASEGNSYAVNSLLIAKAESTMLNVRGDSALKLALLKGNFDILDVWINNQVSISEKDLEYLFLTDMKLPKSTKMSILHKFCCPEYPDALEIAAFCLSFGAEVDYKNENGLTPLYIACSYGFVKMVELLLKRGADPTIRVKTGWFSSDDALSVAVRKFHKECAFLLDRFLEFCKSCSVPKDSTSMYAKLFFSVWNAEGESLSELLTDILPSNPKLLQSLFQVLVALGRAGRLSSLHGLVLDIFQCHKLDFHKIEGIDDSDIAIFEGLPTSKLEKADVNNSEKSNFS